METDRSELNDLAAEHPEIVQALEAIYKPWAERCLVEPWEKILARRRTNG